MSASELAMVRLLPGCARDFPLNERDRPAEMGWEPGSIRGCNRSDFVSGAGPTPATPTPTRTMRSGPNRLTRVAEHGPPSCSLARRPRTAKVRMRSAACITLCLPLPCTSGPFAATSGDETYPIAEQAGRRPYCEQTTWSRRVPHHAHRSRWLWICMLAATTPRSLGADPFMGSGFTGRVGLKRVGSLTGIDFARTQVTDGLSAV